MPLDVVATTPARVRPDGRSEPETMTHAIASGKAGTPAERAAALEGMAHASALPLEEAHEPGLAHCQRCEVLPRPTTGPGTLHLNMPHTHSLGKVLTWLESEGRPYTHRDGTVSIRVEAEGVGGLLPELVARLASTERRDSRAIFQHDGQTLQPADYFRIESLLVIEERERGNWLLELLRADGVVSFFQPIVTGDGGEIFGYECLMRGSLGGRTRSPGEMIETARKTDLVFQLDQAGRKAAITAASRHRLTAKVFVNFTPNAIYDPTHCLDSTVRLVDASGLKRSQVVFEVTESERLPDIKHLAAIVRYYRDKGFAVALDDVGSGYSSLNVLLGLKPDYVKLDMELTRNVHEDRHKAVVARKLFEATAELGLKTVAEGIETREEYEWVRDHGADFVQGYYFAKPAPEPPSLRG